MTGATSELRNMVAHTVNEGLDDFRMGRASNDELVRRVMEIITSVHENALGYGQLIGEERVLDALIEGRLSKGSQRHWWNSVKEKIEAAKR